MLTIGCPCFIIYRFISVGPSAWNSLSSELYSLPQNLSGSFYKLLKTSLPQAWTWSTSWVVKVALYKFHSYLDRNMMIFLCEGRWQFAYWVMGRHFEDPPLYSVYTKDNAVLLIYMDRGINPGVWGVATPRFWAGWTCWPGSTTPQISN